jgi:hypothetical protein
MGKALATDLVGRDSPPLSKYNANVYKTIQRNESLKAEFPKED